MPPPIVNGGLVGRQCCHRILLCTYLQLPTYHANPTPTFHPPPPQMQLLNAQQLCRNNRKRDLGTTRVDVEFCMADQSLLMLD